MDKLGSDEYFKVRRENGEFKLFWKVYRCNEMVCEFSK